MDAITDIFESHEMGGKREWFKHDAWFLADDKIRTLGHEFGPAGPLVAEAFLELAKRQKCAGLVTVKWSYLAEHAFAPKRGLVQLIVQESERLGFVRVHESSPREVVLEIVKWRQAQGTGLSGAERTAAWRDGVSAESDADVTSQNGHGDVTETSPHAGARAVAQDGKKKRERAKALSSSGRSAADLQREKASEEDRRLCRLLAEMIRKHNPKAKIRSEAAWLRSMRLNREQDGNEPAETEQLIRWVFTDPGKDARFWADVIQSPANLREHFAQIWAKMRAPAESGTHIESSAEYLARRGAA
jgi:hypothetical protein